MDSSIINIGRVPKYVGEFIEGNEYKKYNVCSLYGSAFINLDNSNSSIPVNLERDSSGYLTGYTVNRGWDFVANSLDCSVECSNTIKECIDAKNEAIEVIRNINETLQNMIIHDASTDASIMILMKKDESFNQMFVDTPYRIIM